MRQICGHLHIFRYMSELQFLIFYVWNIFKMAAVAAIFRKLSEKSIFAVIILQPKPIIWNTWANEKLFKQFVYIDFRGSRTFVNYNLQNKWGLIFLRLVVSRKRALKFSVCVAMTALDCFGLLGVAPCPSGNSETILSMTFKLRNYIFGLYTYRLEQKKIDFFKVPGRMPP